MIQGNNNQRASQAPRNTVGNQRSPIEDDESQSENEEEFDSTDNQKNRRREQQASNELEEEERETVNVRNKSFITITNSLIGSRFRTKQAQRLENSVIKQTLVPKIKQVFSGHR